MAKSMPDRLATPVAKKVRGRQLTAQEWTFVQEYVAGAGSVSAKEAAIRAGYKESYAQEAARRLTEPGISPHVVAAIQEVRAEMAEKYGTSYERHMRDMQIIRDRALAAGAFGAAVQAEFRRGQALGTIYIDRKEIRHGTIDSMSREEVMRKLEEIKKVYGGAGGPIIDITPEQVEESLPLEREAGSDEGVEPEESESGSDESGSDESGSDESESVESVSEEVESVNETRVEDVPTPVGGVNRGRPKLPFIPNRKPR